MPLVHFASHCIGGRLNKVAILGAGNIGHALAALIGANPLLNVTLWSPNWDRRADLTIAAIGPEGTYAIGAATMEPSLVEAVRDADVVVLAVPTHGRRRILERARRQLNQCSLLITWEGTGWFREDLVEFGIGSPMAVGLQRSPLMSRIRQLGEKVEILGVRSEVVAAATRQEDRPSAGALLTAILPFKIAMAPSYACVSVSPGNPLIHPARLFGWQIRGEPLPDAGLSFYGDWEDVSSMVLIELHRELAGLRESLRLPKRFLKTLVDRPVVQTPRQVTHDIVSETCLHEIRMPVRQARLGLSLDRRHRFFREDIGQGLAHILDIARQADVSMPMAAAIHRWYCGASREHAIFRPALVDDAPGGRLR